MITNSILTKVFATEEREDLGLCGKFATGRILLLKHPLFRCIVVVPSTIFGSISLDRAVAHTHSKVSIRRHLTVGIHNARGCEVFTLTLFDIQHHLLRFVLCLHNGREYAIEKSNSRILIQDLFLLVGRKVEEVFYLIGIGYDTLLEYVLSILFCATLELLINELEDVGLTICTYTLTYNVEHGGEDLHVERGEIVFVKLFETALILRHVRSLDTAYRVYITSQTNNLRSAPKCFV